MADLATRREGAIGRATLTRPAALNALTHEMALALEAALDAWRDDPAVALVLIDAEGEKAFCAGGDIAELYHAGRAGDFEAGRSFWRDEYRLNTKLAEYPKPVVSLMRGFVMGGGVGLGCHVSHRVVGESTRVSMPECGIGLIPDVGATRILGAAPGGIGRYAVATGARLGPADAILAGFADRLVPEARWPDLVAALVATGDVAAIAAMAEDPGSSALAAERAAIDAAFADGDVPAILARLAVIDTDFARGVAATIEKASPLSLACALAILDDYEGGGIREALRREFRFTYRSSEDGDFLEGVRAQIIDRDRQPKWRHTTEARPSAAEVAAMLASLGAQELEFDREVTVP